MDSHAFTTFYWTEENTIYECEAEITENGFHKKMETKTLVKRCEDKKEAEEKLNLLKNHLRKFGLLHDPA